MKNLKTAQINYFLAPHVLRNIAKNGSIEQRNNALETLAFDSSFRITRKTHPLFKHLNTIEEIRSSKPNEQRLIFDAQHEQTPTGKLIRAEGAPASHEKSVDEAYSGLGATYDFYWKIFERNSIDDAGMKLEAVVHFAKNYNNAFWNGEIMVFGDGDGDLFNRFTTCLDVIGHELTHGVTQHEASLTYSGQSGALNESLSDVFGSLIKQYHRKQKATEADWIIGEGLLTNKVNGIGLRSMKAPGTAYDDKVLGKDMQPANFKNYIETYQDNGGVHLNSGIPNHAFYLMATRMDDFAWEKAGRIWYETIRNNRLKSNASFKDFATLNIQISQKLYGANSEEYKITQACWKEVGIF